MDGFKVAKVVSMVFVPYVHPLYLFPLLTMFGASDVHDCLIGIVLYAFLPLAIHAVLLVLKRVDIDVVDRASRVPMLATAVAMYVASYQIFRCSMSKLVALIYTFVGITIMATLIFTKVSVHVASFVPSIVAFAKLGLVHLAVALAIAMLVTAWSRAILDKHTPAQISLALVASFGSSLPVLVIH